LVDLTSARRPAPRPRFPDLSRFGIAVMAFGLLLDFVEHDLVGPTGTAAVVGFSVGEHAAHLVVLVGMVLVLAGIVRAGRGLERRHPHSTGG
jgi:uncharacterized membrane protein YidH (DUF202 family)